MNSFMELCQFCGDLSISVNFFLRLSLRLLLLRHEAGMLLLNSCVIKKNGCYLYDILNTLQLFKSFTIRVPNKGEIGSSSLCYVRYVRLRHSEKMGIYDHCSHIFYLSKPIRLTYIYIAELVSYIYYLRK